MPSILSEEDKETVKRVVPKQTNKIQAVAVARLYVAYPNRSKWTYTGLQGAIVLANDLVGNTYWIKMVDVSVSLSYPYRTSCTDNDQACRPRRDMGSGNLRIVVLQCRPDILPHLRDRGLLGRPLFRRRERSQTVQEEDG